MASSVVESDRSLLLLILDITPTVWGKREHYRRTSDQRRSKQNKPSLGPATLSDTISAITSFLLTFASCHRDNTIVVIGVSGSHFGVLYPRKDALNDLIHESMEDEGGCRVDVNELRQGLLLGIEELMNRFSQEKIKEKQEVDLIQQEKIKKSGTANVSATATATAITAATSLALCLINRFMIASGNDRDHADSLLHRKEDTGILSMISTGSNSGGGTAISSAKDAAELRRAQRRARGMLSPRIMILQASEDNTPDYNAFMNCVFCANKNDVVIDGCFIPSGSGAKDEPDTSTFLEQACDRTGGVYSTPKGRAQICGGLSSVLMTLFLPTLAIRKGLNMTKVNKVDFRARCFETGDSLEIGMVCNLCLSIFKEEPKGGFCHTCGAKVTGLTERGGGNNDCGDSTNDSPTHKRMKT
jgi:transcription initiation factor TFIIH subunit 3